MISTWYGPAFPPLWYWRAAALPGMRQRWRCQRWWRDVGAYADRGAIRDLRVHARGAGGLSSAGAGQRRRRNNAGVATDEPRWRRARACSGARCGDRASLSWAIAGTAVAGPPREPPRLVSRF